MALPHPDWLYHHLQVRGDPEAVAGFREAAARAGVIPWQQDLGPAAEDWFHLLAAPLAPQQRSRQRQVVGPRRGLQRATCLSPLLRRHLGACFLPPHPEGLAASAPILSRGYQMPPRTEVAVDHGMR
jgi:hypothetical protein